MFHCPQILLLLETSREFGRGLLRGISRYASLHGPWSIQLEPLFYLGREHPAKETSQPLKWLSDGAIIRETWENEERRLPVDLPVIQSCFHSGGKEGKSVILTDDYQIGVMAAEHFISKGHKRLAFAGFDGMYWSQRRFEGFRAKAASSGCEVIYYVQPQDEDGRLWDNEQFFLADWLRKLKKPAAVMACNDDRASQIISLCRQERITIPSEIAVLGVDNDEFICKLAYPQLSSISLSLEKAGFEAAGHLDNMIKSENRNPKTIIIEPMKVVERTSSDAVAVPDPDVSLAVRFILDNKMRPVQVCDVVQAAAVSKRSLYMKFNLYLGTSIYRYIKNVRVGEIEKLLLYSDMNITQISKMLGFGSSDHIASFFRSVKGLNPADYRNRYRP
ncbi:Xylose operon regulatory protein [Sedimentisphaera cyanobacteriorum]|uniref:Xylose operon regulatory protein n=1 Tax=Sedimentisphaera cyanobacteriorum TaxID=1940790 RepID=A0A1Q2HS96_9BACT|nr:DNA-binding transcriptional regulator [Sedimentisphaera cyanobacteriorum]AQQ10144.1 Xylose operon regulatory protein [Sedimentisphaera cyanobacteriorum]